VRTVYSCTVKKEGDMILIRVTGSGFLYNMVRILAGTLIEIGFGARQPEDMNRILEARDRSAAGPTAPARGLTMVGIEFAKNPCILSEKSC
jgi:tRNA pseudouridine38-40 synthase